MANLPPHFLKLNEKRMGRLLMNPVRGQVNCILFLNKSPCIKWTDSYCVSYTYFVFVIILNLVPNFLLVEVKWIPGLTFTMSLQHKCYKHRQNGLKCLHAVEVDPGNQVSTCDLALGTLWSDSIHSCNQCGTIYCQFFSIMVSMLKFKHF